MFVTFLCMMSVLGFVSLVSASVSLSEPSVCCERTNAGAWCVNEPESMCDTAYKTAPAACASTSYCALGTCYDSLEGVCYENTPQRVCDEYGGTWDGRSLDEVPQCQLGCCVIADQAAFVPLVRCKKLATYFGVDVDYRTDIPSEAACIVLANSQDMGACVYEKDFERVCEFITRADCGADESVSAITDVDQVGSERRFYKDYLCSAEELNTVCARQASTGCYQGKAYYFDSCGNRENIYHGDRDRSWNNGRLADPEAICAANDGSDPNCGNCEYLFGARCEETHALLSGERAFCQRTDCTDRFGESRLNGESWCVNDGTPGGGLDKAGSRYFREVCVDGEVHVEPCEDFRNQVCYETSLETSKGEYAVAACRVNRWQSCIGITDKNQCLNGDNRDCMWLSSPVGLLIGGGGAPGAGGSPGVSGFSNPTAGVNNGFSNSVSGLATAPVTGNAILGDTPRLENESTATNRDDGVCVPRYPPGLQFWEEGSSQQICGMVAARCVVEYTKGLFGGWECSDNCECLEATWSEDVNQICVAQGDCGAYINYVGTFTDSGYEWLSPSGKKAFKSSSETYIKSGFGNAQVIFDVDASSTSLNQRLLLEVART